MNLTQQEALLVQLGVIADALSIVMAKRQDYSGNVDPFGNLRTSTTLDIHPVVGTFNRMLDKIVRIKTMVNQGTLEQGGLVGESAADAFRDIINYNCIAAGLVAEEVPALYKRWMDLGERFEEVLEQVTGGFPLARQAVAESCAFSPCSECAECELGVPRYDDVEIDQSVGDDLDAMFAELLDGLVPGGVTWFLCPSPGSQKPE